MTTCRFITYGCKVNQYDTEALREDLQARGVGEAHGGASDVVVVNTCTVTETAAREALRDIRRLAAQPGARVVVTGCMVGTHREVLEGIPGVRLLAPNEAKARVGNAIKMLETLEGGRGTRGEGRETGDGGQGTGDGGTPSYSSPRPSSLVPRPPPPVQWLEGDPAETFRSGIRRFEGRTRAYVKVQDGCNLVCSYCIIPKVRGRSRSRPIDDAVEEVRRLVEAGYRELVLTGVHLGSFGRDLPGRPRFGRLLERLLAVPGDWRLRLSSIEVSELDDEDIALLGELTDYCGLRIADCGMKTSGHSNVPPGFNSQSTIRNPHSCICPHFHLPLQSGSPSVLRRMRRPYTLEQFERKTAALRARMPDTAITTDLIVGFPGETERDFEATTSAARRLAFSRVHVFPYSERKGTEAARMPGALPVREIKARVRALAAAARDCAADFHRRFVGRTVTVLVEDRPDRRTGRPCGYSEHYMRVLLAPGRPVSGLVPVQIERSDADGAEGVVA